MRQGRAQDLESDQPGLSPTSATYCMVLDMSLGFSEPQSPHFYKAVPPGGAVVSMG